MAQRSWWVRGVVLGSALLLAPVGAWADKLTDLEQAFETQQKSLQQLQQEMQRLRQERTAQQAETDRRVMEVEQKAQAAAASSVVTGFDPWPGKGFYLKSADGQHRLSIGGYIQTLATIEGGQDDALGTAPAPLHRPSTFKLHRVRLILNGQLYKDWGFHVETHIADGPTGNNTVLGSGLPGGDSSTRLEWAVATYTYAPWAKVAVGQMRNHYGLEMTMATQDLDFAAQRSIVSRALSPDLQLGLHLSGDLKQFVGIPVYYGIGVFNGCGRYDQCNSIDNDGKKEATGRIAIAPPLPWGNLTIGFNGDYRTFENKRGGSYDLATNPHRNAAGAVNYHVFNPTSVTGVPLAGSGFRINGDRYTSGADLYYEFYPFFVRGEYHYALQQRNGLGAGGSDLDTLTVQGGYGTLGFWIFGNKQKGLLLAGRYEQLRIDDDGGKFDPALGTTEVGTDIRVVTTGLTWHFNPNIWLRGNYIFTNVSPHANIIGMSSSGGGGEAHQGMAELMLRF